MNRRSFLCHAAAFALAGVAAPGLLAQPRPGRFTPTRFSVAVRGRGRDVLMIPGLMSGRHIWDAAVRATPGYRYHLLQVAGFAGEPVGGNATGRILAPLVEEVSRYIEANGLDRPAIVGHSMGGTLAMMIGANAPLRAGRIMVVDMLPQPSGLLGANAEGMRGLADGLRDLAATPGGRRLFESLVSGFAPPEAADRRSDSDVVARAMHELATTDLTADLARIRAPLTVVYAAPDPRNQARIDSDYRTSYAAKADARLVRIDNSGHMVMQDQPARFAEELRRFLAN